jgi:hypothetical protein
VYNTAADLCCFSVAFQRLDDYYKRNYRDYFGLMEGQARQKKENELTESEKRILEWLDKNN